MTPEIYARLSEKALAWLYVRSHLDIRKDEMRTEDEEGNKGGGLCKRLHDLPLHVSQAFACRLKEIAGTQKEVERRFYGFDDTFTRQGSQVQSLYHPPVSAEASGNNAFSVGLASGSGQRQASANAIRKSPAIAGLFFAHILQQRRAPDRVAPLQSFASPRPQRRFSRSYGHSLA
jgi:hypothetical protein